MPKVISNKTYAALKRRTVELTRLGSLQLQGPGEKKYLRLADRSLYLRERQFYDAWLRGIKPLNWATLIPYGFLVPVIQGLGDPSTPIVQSPYHVGTGVEQPAAMAVVPEFPMDQWGEFTVNQWGLNLQGLTQVDIFGIAATVMLRITDASVGIPGSGTGTLRYYEGGVFEDQLILTGPTRYFNVYVMRIRYWDGAAMHVLAESPFGITGTDLTFFGHVPSGGHRYRFEADQNVLSLYLNDVLQLQVTDGSIANVGTGRLGLKLQDRVFTGGGGFSGGDGYLRDFGGGPTRRGGPGNALDWGRR